jgi:NhaA family Na+:H+ antiporter
MAEVLRRETVGGILLLIAAIAALLWANAHGSSYESMRDFRFGPSALHLDLTVGQWAADGLLAIFFFVAGLELKREFVAGDLSSPAHAAVPVLAAVGGMVVPALVYVAVNFTSDDRALRGWAIPTATDIAFALAVLAVIGSHLPVALRTFLLTLAVVDDLLAITVIAVVFTSSLSWAPLAGAAVCVALFGALVQRRRTSLWLLLPIAVASMGAGARFGHPRHSGRRRSGVHRPGALGEGRAGRRRGYGRAVRARRPSGVGGRGCTGVRVLRSRCDRRRAERSR